MTSFSNRRLLFILFQLLTASGYGALGLGQLLFEKSRPQRNYASQRKQPSKKMRLGEKILPRLAPGLRLEPQLELVDPVLLEQEA